MRELGARGVTRDQLREDLQRLESRLDAKAELLEERMEMKMELVEARMDKKLANLESRILGRMNDQTRTFVRTLYVSNSALVLAVAALAFGAARLA